MDRATQKSIEWQKTNHPMAIGGDAFADMVDFLNVNPAFVAGYKEAEKDLALTEDDIKEIDEWISVIQTSDNLTGKELYKEVLRRFNEQRKK